MGEEQLKKGWEQVNSLSSQIQNLKKRYESLKREYGNVSAQISVLSPDYDEDGNDRNEDIRADLESRLSAINSELNYISTEQNNLKSQAGGLALDFREKAGAAEESAQQHSKAAAQLGRASGYRFGASTAAAGRRAASDHREYYASLAQEMERLALAATALAQGGTAAGSSGALANYGGFQNPGSRAGTAPSGGASRLGAAGTGHRTAAAGRRGGGLVNRVSQSILQRLGKSAPGKGGGQPDFSAVSHGTVAGAFSGSDGDRQADRLFAGQTGMTLSEVEEYRTQNGLVWQSNPAGTETSLIPKSFAQKHAAGEGQRGLCAALNAAGFQSKNFGRNVAVRSGISADRWYAAGSAESYRAYNDFNENYESYHRETYDLDKRVIKTVDPSKIEGIDLFNEADHPQRFWSQHDKEGTEDTFIEKYSSHIPEVAARLRAGADFHELSMDPVLGPCANLYFNEGGRGMVTVYEGEGFYEFTGDGRHRVLAARALGHEIPVRILGTVRHK